MKISALTRWTRLLICLGLLSIPQYALEASAGDTIVFIGDSITAGYGLDPDAAYPALIEKKMKARGHDYAVVNAGVSGDTTAGGLRRVAWVLRGSEPAIVVIALGGNDGLRGVPVEQTRANLRGIIDKVRSLSPDTEILLAGMRMPPNMGAAYTERFFESFAIVAEEKNVDRIPFLLEGVGGMPELNQSDAIHPNAAGQQVIAETVWESIQPKL